MPTPYPSTSPHSPSISPAEEIFVEKYGLLSQWALRLTEGDREQAEDLLHEAFVQFTLRQPDLSAVGNIDGYLYAVLKHLHLALLRRAKHDPLRQISLVEFDSVDLALRSSYDVDRTEVQNDLRRTCAFLCWRKASAKSASYLILRFFHGYYPEEIVRIARTSRNVVDHGIRVASGEAKLSLSNPGKLHFMPGGTKDKQRGEFEFVPGFEPKLFAVPAAEFLHALDQIILANRADACLPKEELLRHYSAPSLLSSKKNKDNVVSIDRGLLAHLVSCPPCLDAVNHHLQMPPLSDRFPGERLGRYRGGSGESGTTIRRASKVGGAQMRYEQAFKEMLAAKGSILRVAQSRLRECFEHRPRKLFVAVNGEIVAAQDVASDHNKQYIHISHEAAVDFVEIFSEQGVRLAFISTRHPPLDGQETLFQDVSLSAGRSLQAVLEITSSDLSLEVTYSDSLLVNAIDLSGAESDHSLQLVAGTGKNSGVTLGWWDRATKPFLASVRERLSGWLDSFRPLALASAFFLIFGAVAGLYFARSNQGSREVGALLTEVAQRENRPIQAGYLTHRVLEFEETSLDGQQTIERGTVNIWRGSDKKQLAMLLSSPDGKLKEGLWETADGTYLAYKDKKLTTHAAAPRKLQDAVTTGDPGSMWMKEPLAGDFKELAAGRGAILLHSFHKNSMIDYQPVSQDPDNARPHLIDAVLTLDSNRRAVHEVLWIERNGEVRRYSYNEIGYENREATSADMGIFSPSANLSRGYQPVRGEPALPHGGGASLAHLNLEAFMLLNAVNADSGEQITVTRLPPDHLSIRGILSSDERLAQVRHALAPMEGNPSVDIALASADNLKPPLTTGHFASKASQVAIKSYEIDAQTIPAQVRLKTYFSNRGYSGKELDSEIESFCQEALRHSSRALQQAWTLHSLASSFNMSDLQHMSQEDRRQWIALYLRHSTTLQSEMQAIHQSLDVLAPAGSSDGTGSKRSVADSAPSPSLDQASIQALSDQLLEQSSKADSVLRSTLTASGYPPQDVDALCQKLQLLTANADRAIREIEHRAENLEVSQVVH